MAEIEANGPDDVCRINSGMKLEPPSTVAISVDRTDLLSTTDRLAALLSPLGGLSTFVRPGMTVLVKPDLTAGSDGVPETHLELAVQVGRLAQAAGAKVAIGDSPALAEAGVERLWKQTRLEEMAGREGLHLLNIEKSATVPVAVETRIYYLPQPVVEADLIVNLSRRGLNATSRTGGAIGNVFGVLPGFHMGMGAFKGRISQSRRMAQIAVDLLSVLQPGLNIFDALDLQNPAWLAASADAVALDTVIASLAGVDPQTIFSIRYASEAGLGIGWLEAIATEGDVPQAVSRGGRGSRGLTGGVLTGTVADAIGSLVTMKPEIDPARCSDCGICISSCPAGAIRCLPDRIGLTIERRLCISCWRCHESCPKAAIFVRKSWLARQLVG